MTTNTTHAYFDLHDYIRSIQSVDVAAQMAQSAAFALDCAITAATRGLIKTLKDANIGNSIMSFNEITMALRDEDFAAQFMADAGQSIHGPVSTVNALVAVRDEWQELASELVGMTFRWDGTPRVYEIEPIEDVLDREVTLKIKPQTERRIKLQVYRHADGESDEDIQKVLDRRLEREEQKLKDISRVLNDQRGALVTLLSLASTSQNFGSAPKEFHELPAHVRLAMINAALKGCARADEYAASSSSITDAEFDQISFAVIKAERELKGVLRSPQYTHERMVAEI